MCLVSFPFELFADVVAKVSANKQKTAKEREREIKRWKETKHEKKS